MFKNKQIVSLFFSGLAVLFTGMGLFPILPLYAANFDASGSTTGFYLAIIYAANSLGPLVTGWLIMRFSKRLVFIVGGLVGSPALVGLSLATTFFQVVLFTSLVWFSGGVVMALVSILTGLHIESSHQGKAFSLMAMVGPLGSLAGGAAVGRLISWQGYGLMFMVLAVVWSIIPLIGWLFLKEGPQRKAPAAHDRMYPQERTSTRLGVSFVFVLAMTFLGSMAVNVSRFGSSLAMHWMNFSPEAVSSVAVVSGLIAIPVTLAIGAYSDRLGRKHFLFASYLLAMSGTLILVSANALWQFWLASILHLMAFSVSGAMSQALTSEVVPEQALSKGLSWMNTLSAAASILCFAVGGVLFDVLGMPVVFIMAASLALLAGIGIEALVHPGRTAAAVQDCTEMSSS